MLKSLLRCVTILSAGFLLAAPASAITYSTIAGGNINNPATWAGGNVPPSIFSSGDTIIINTGHNVMLNQDLAINNAGAYLDISGALSSLGTEYIAMNAGNKFSISGTLHIDSIFIVNAPVSNITGQMTVRSLRCMTFNASGSGTVAFKDLYALGQFSNTGNCTVKTSPGSTIYMMGGTITQGGTGNTMLGPDMYNLVYTVGAFARYTGYELEQTALVKDVTIDVADTAHVRLGNHAHITNGNLTLKRGFLVLNNFDLNFEQNGTLVNSGSGYIKSNTGSSIRVINNNGLQGPLRFAPGAGVDSLIQGSGGTANTKLATPLRITRQLLFKSGKVEVLDTCTLSLVTGANIAGADADKYVVTTGTGSLASDIGPNNTFAYYIGTANHFAPVVVTSNNSTTYNGLKARVNTGVKTMGTTGDDMATKQPMVNGTWFLEDKDAAAVDVNVELAWLPGMEAGLFDRSIAYVSQFLINYWDKVNGKAAYAGPSGTNAIKRTGIKTFGPLSVFDNNTVNVKNIVTQQHISIYPNPATNMLNVDVNQPAQLVIYNTAGQPVSSSNVDAANKTINVSALPQGMYYLQLKGDGVNGTAKFIKQ